MAEIIDEYPSNVQKYKVRTCPFCNNAPVEITHMVCLMLFKDGSTEESRAVVCGTVGCGVYGPIRDSAQKAVQAWNGSE